MDLVARLMLCRLLFSCFFNLPISLGQQRLKIGQNLGPQRVIPYSPIKLLELGFQPVRSRYMDSCCIQKQLMKPYVLAGQLMDRF